MNGYDTIKTVAADLGCRVTDILAMSPRRDPFYCGQPAQMRDAEWFTELYDRLGFSQNVHLRRIHYKLVSQADLPIKPDGTAYQNTDKDWKWFCESAVAARTVGLVDVQDFIDRRNPDPLILRNGDCTPSPSVSMGLADFSFYTLDTELIEPNLNLPGVRVSGYEYTDDDQPYLLEIWVEKTTMNDVLEPICRKYNANLVTAAGFQSITAAIKLIERATSTGKAARIFYVSDFDPAGVLMPPSVARQLEYWIRQYGLDIDIALNPVALTADQVRQYNLPRIPIKESDKRRKNFERRYGTGATELDALEALHPGELHRLVDEAIAPYWDGTLKRLMSAHSADIEDCISRQWNARIEPVRDELESVEEAITSVMEDYQDALAGIAAGLESDLHQYRERLDGLESTVDAERDGFEIEPPERLKSDLEPPDETDWLFSSTRGYMEQIAHYRKEAA